MKAIKTNKSSEYWMDFEAELSVYYHLKWVHENSRNIFSTGELDFFIFFLHLTNKYSLAVPINCTKNNLIAHYEEEKIKHKGNGKSNWLFMFFLYKNDKTLIYPTKLFTNVNDNSPRNLICLDPYLELKNLNSLSIGFGAKPLTIELREINNEIILSIYIDNDIFNLEIDNKKTKRDPEIGGKDCWVDNSELAYLNTPRLNSFLRDLKKLCFEYGADTFEFENLGLNDFCEDGVQFNGEVVYYEDIADMLEPHQRIENF